jgi:hypothetical protein
MNTIINILDSNFIETGKIFNVENKHGYTLLIYLINRINHCKYHCPMSVYIKNKILVNKLVEKTNFDEHLNRYFTPLILSIISCDEEDITINILKHKKIFKKVEDPLLELLCIKKYKQSMKVLINKNWNTKYDHTHDYWLYELPQVEDDDELVNLNFEDLSFFKLAIVSKQHDILKYYYHRQFRI